MQSIQSAREGAFGTISQAFADLKSEKTLDEANAEAEKRTKETTIPHFVHNDNGQYKVISIKDVANWFITDIQKVNRGLFQNLIKADSNWKESFRKFIGNEGIAAVGLYVSKTNPNTQLFQGIESAKGFFVDTYRETIKTQNALIEQKKIHQIPGDITKLFSDTIRFLPELANNDELQSALKSGHVEVIYNYLATKGTSSENVKKIMESIDRDINKIKIESTKAALSESIKWRRKTFNDLRGEFIINEENEKFFKKIGNKRVEIDNITSEEKSLLLALIKPQSELKKYLQSLQTREIASRTQASAHAAKQEASRYRPDEKIGKLTPEGEKRVQNAAEVGVQLSRQEIHTNLAKLNDDPRDIELQRQISEQKTADTARVAVAVTNYVQSPGVSKEDSRDLFRKMTGTTVSDEQIDKWIDTQVFLSKYVEEKNFVDIIEKNAAYMNLGETKSIGELYENGKLNIANMSEESGSVKLGETSIMGQNSFVGMNELMNCRVEVGDSGVLSRTIRTPEGQIIAKNIPVENIPTTIEQLGRFYAIGLGPLVPKMERVNAYISKVRPDAIGGTDGTYGIREDEKFLRIMTILIYGQEKIPKETNIPNLIRVFNQPGRENNPALILKQKGILRESGGINDIALKEQLETASAKI
ncbi:MAG: hypothetical protein PHY14_00815 [Candidatus Gracilibacteria bacterium]|nr:hypothetical protein [Candidatus Gracilibacteria bacterium]